MLTCNLKQHLTTCTIAKENSSDIDVGPSTRHRYRTQHQSETNTEGYSMTPLDNLVSKTDLSANGQLANQHTARTRSRNPRLFTKVTNLVNKFHLLMKSLVYIYLQQAIKKCGKKLIKPKKMLFEFL